MERLTRYDGCYYDDMDNVDVEELYSRLMEYENAEAEGLLLRLPCRPGDTVYVVRTKCLSGLYDYECDMHDEETDCPCHLDSEWIVFKKQVDLEFLVKIIMKKNPNFILGETVFSSRKEAEAKLIEITAQHDSGRDEYVD